MQTMTKEQIGERLRSMREERGMTKRFVSKKTGIRYRTFCSYEYGERIPSDQNKVILAEFFGTTVGELFFAEQDHET